MVKSSTTGDLNSTGLVASLAPNKGTPIDTIKEWSISTYKVSGGNLCILNYVGIMC